MRLLGAIFDMDGVLLDSNYIWRGLGARFLRRYGVEPESDLRRVLQPLTMEDTAIYFRDHYRIPRTAAEIAQEMTDMIRGEYAQNAPAKAGVDKVLSILKMSGVTMYVATATDRTLAEAALRRTDLLRYFKGIMTCSEAGASPRSTKSASPVCAATSSTAWCLRTLSALCGQQARPVSVSPPCMTRTPQMCRTRSAPCLNSISAPTRNGLRSATISHNITGGTHP